MSVLRRIISWGLLKLIPNDILSRILFDLKLLLNGAKKSELLILATITKTGTHYLRFLIAYYIEMLSLKRMGSNYHIESDDFIVDNYFPNSWHTSYTFIRPRKKSTHLLKLIGLSDFPRSHMKLRKHAWRNVKVLHTYRDLHDQAMVSWHMKYACDSLLRDEISGPEALYVKNKKDNLAQLESFKNLSVQNINHLRISFGDIFRDPANALALILQWLGEEPDMELCLLAADLAKKTPSIIVGGGEKWHRENRDQIDYKMLNSFIEKNRATGAIGVGGVIASQLAEKAESKCVL